MLTCHKCTGTKKYLGNGMIVMDCDYCNADGKIPVPANHGDLEPKPFIDRRSQSYKVAITDIMALNPKISREEAVKIFDKEYAKES
jgi:hypothetical protein